MAGWGCDTTARQGPHAPAAWRRPDATARRPAAGAAVLSCPACKSAVEIRQADRPCCTACGTIWIPRRRGYAYNDAYPAERGHDDPAIARCKQRTLDAWMRRLDMNPAGQRVLEVGFGGGATLTWLQDRGAQAFGQEPVAANRRAAIAGGIPADHVAAELAEFTGQRFDLVVYQDSFEHVLDPEAHLRGLDAITAPGTRAMLVLPVADSVSRRTLRDFWPHDIDDHWIFYSTGGLSQLWQRFGWRPVARFYPWKFVSLMTVARHVRIKTGVALPLGPLGHLGARLNLGERGLVFEKLPVRAA